MKEEKIWIEKSGDIYITSNTSIKPYEIDYGDLISRQKVMDAIADFITYEMYEDKHHHITFEPLVEMINAIPALNKRESE